MSIIDTLEPWFKGAIGPVVGYVLGVATPYGRRLMRVVRKLPELQVYVEHDPAIIFANEAFNTVGCPMFVPGSTDTLAPGPIQDAFAIRRWALENDGMPANTDAVEITLTAWEKLDVIVDAVTINCREIPLPKGIVVFAMVGGASVERRRLDVSLAAGWSRAEYFDITGQTSNFSFKLTSGETAKIHLSAGTGYWSGEIDEAFEWTAELHLLVNNKRKTITIGDNGKPFEFVKAGVRPGYLWDGQKWIPF